MKIYFLIYTIIVLISLFIWYTYHVKDTYESDYHRIPISSGIILLNLLVCWIPVMNFVVLVITIDGIAEARHQWQRHKFILPNWLDKFLNTKFK